MLTILVVGGGVAVLATLGWVVRSAAEEREQWSAERRRAWQAQEDELALLIMLDDD